MDEQVIQLAVKKLSEVFEPEAIKDSISLHCKIKRGG
jgi:hypothetical protein